MIAWQVRIREGKLDREGERTVALNMYQLMYGLQAANIRDCSSPISVVR